MKINFIKFIFATLIFSANLWAFLPPNEAFKLDVKKNANDIEVKMDIGKDIYLYDEKLKISLIKPKKISLDDIINRPIPVTHENMKVFWKQIHFFIPQALLEKYAKGKNYTLEIKFQGCSTAGLCYQPIKKTFTFGENLQQKENQTAKQVKEEKPQTNSISQQDEIAKNLKNSSIFWILLTMFGYGLLLSLTPCIFPMIPILSSIIVSQDSKDMNIKKGFILSFVYVFFMSIAYAIAGIVAAIFGANIQAALQNPIAIWIFSLIFIALALSMFGFYDIELPKSLQAYISKKSDNAKGKGLISVAIMGFLSALIVGPCVAAPLMGVLIYIAQSGDILLGAIALFVLSFGMGVPLLIIGATSGKFLPKPGIWMENIKAVFGVIMLGVAIYFLGRILDEKIIMILWGILIITSSVYLGVFEPLRVQNGWGKLLKSISVITLIYGFFVFAGAFLGSKSVLDPLNLHFSTSSKPQEASFKKVSSLEQLKQEIKSSNKPVMLDFWATWCVSCKEMQELTFSDESVKNELKNFTLLQVDVTKNDSNNQEILQNFGLYGPPSILFFKENKEIKNQRVVGFKKPDEFLSILKSM